jgi:hypothetical protein
VAGGVQSKPWYLGMVGSSKRLGHATLATDGCRIKHASAPVFSPVSIADCLGCRDSRRASKRVSSQTRLTFRQDPPRCLSLGRPSIDANLGTGPTRRQKAGWWDPPPPGAERPTRARFDPVAGSFDWPEPGEADRALFGARSQETGVLFSTMVGEDIASIGVFKNDSHQSHFFLSVCLFVCLSYRSSRPPFENVPARLWDLSYRARRQGP